MEVDPPSPQEGPLAMEVDPSPSAASSLPPASSPPTPVGKPTPIPAAKSLHSQPSNHAKLGPDPCAHVLYFDLLVVPNAQTAGLDHVGCYCLSLTQVMEALFKVNNTISLFPYGLPQSSECNILSRWAPLWVNPSPS